MSRLIVAALALSAVALCYGSFQVLGHELSLVPGNRTVELFNKGRTISDNAITRLRRSRERALGWYDNGKTWGEFGLALMLQDERHGDDGEVRARALTALHESLRRRPVQPHTWLRYGIVQARSGAPTDSVAEALMASLDTGPYEFEILLPRMQMLMQYVRPFPVSADSGLAAQIWHVWQQEPEKLLDAAVATGTVQAVASAIAHDDDALAALVDGVIKRR